MILYFDCLIKDALLFPGIFVELDKIRESNSVYRFQPRIEITKYMLASYAEIKWSNVIIKYGLLPEDKKKQKNFEKFVKKLWPKAKIIYGQSEKISEYRKISKLINKFKDNWVFYAGNNDHPFIAPNKEALHKCLSKAEELSQKNKYVSIIYSHFPEPLHMARKGVILHDIGWPNSKILEENNDTIVAEFKGYYSAMQIVNKNLFNLWINTEISESAPLWRLEDLYKYVPMKKRKKQIIVIPKEQLCAHFDGYSHNKGTGYFIPSNLVPPLFIPPGFFDKKIKIAYGQEGYRKGWVNINPLKKQYSFENPTNGTDLMITLKDIPLFWKKRIQKIDINPKADLKKLKNVANKRRNRIRNPYFRRTLLNFPFYEAYVYQFRMRNLLKRIFSTIKPVDNLIKKIERKYKIKL